MGGPNGDAVEIGLLPPNPDCARLTALLWDDHEIDLHVGHSIPIELWYKPHESEELAEDVTAWVAAVVEGDVTETVWRRRGEVVKGRMKIRVGDKWHRASYRSLPTTVSVGRTDKVVYEYDAYPA